MLSNRIAILRAVGLIESLSSFALFFIAMPIKYVDALGGNPKPVSIVGAVHGGLFVLFVITLLYVIWTVGLPRGTVVRAIFSAILPFPFEPLVLDPRLRARQQELVSRPESD